MSSNPCLARIKLRPADPAAAESGVMRAESCVFKAICPYGNRISNDEPLHTLRAGIQFSPDSVYVVRSGCVRLVERSGDIGWASFRLPGEILGTQCLLNKRGHRLRAMATVDTQLCRLPSRLLLNDMHGDLKLAETLIHAFQLEQELLSSALFRHRMHSDAQLADFLLDMKRRMPGVAGAAQPLVELMMNRCDIASHLGLTHETVSRVLKRLADNGLIKVKNKKIHLLDLDELTALAASGKECISRL